MTTCEGCNGNRVIAIVRDRLIDCPRCAGKGWTCFDGECCRAEGGDTEGDGCDRLDETRSDAQQNEHDEIASARAASRQALALRVARVLLALALDDVNDAARVCRSIVDEFEP